MSEKKEIISEDEKVQITDTALQNTLEDNPAEAVTDAQSEKHENGSLDGSVKMQEKGQQHQQCTPTRRMMSGLPPIDLNQLTTILRDPSMPSQEIMKEVADKIGLRCKESESDDNTVGGTGRVVGMKGLLDCIFEVTIQRPDSDNSDDDETFQRIPREIPCSFCNKIFGSTMRWKTHVLVAHQDPSVLNIKRLSTSEGDKKEKSNTSHRRYFRHMSKPDTGGTDTKTRHSAKTDSKQAAEAFHKEESIPDNQRQSSMVSPLQTAKPVRPSDKRYAKRQVPQAGNDSHPNIFPSEAEQVCKDVSVDTPKVINIGSMVNAPSLQIQESTTRNIDSAEDKEVHSPIQAHTEPQTFEKGPDIHPSSQKTVEGEQKEHSSMSDKSATKNITAGEDSVGGRKRKATSPTQESSSPPSSSLTPSSNSKRSRKHAVEEPGSSPTHENE